MTTTEFILAIAALLLGGGVLTGAAWWVISGVFALRGRLIRIEGEIALVKARVEGIEVRCHGREQWLREIAWTVSRTDKNVVRLGARLDVEIEE